MGKTHNAVKEKDYDSLEDCIAHGISVDIQDKKGNTPLIYATLLGSRSMVKYLLEKGADLFLRNDKGERPLGIAKEKGDKPMIKLLVIRQAIAKRYIESPDNEEKEVLINKLITTLLYKSNRYKWDDPHCKRIRYYLHCLTEKFTDYKKSDYAKYIFEKEAESGTFFGCYLSDDSDSEAEKTFNRLGKSKKGRKKKKAEIYQERAQLERIFYKNNTSLHKRGDLKDIPHASRIFDLNQRTEIAYGDEINKKTIKKDLKKLNKLISEGASLEEAKKKIETIFYIAQYRGITHLTSKWNRPSRILHRQDEEINKPQYSASIYKSMGINLYKDYAAGRECVEEGRSNFEHEAETLREILLTLREPLPCAFEKYSYANIAYLLQNIYTQDYDGFHELLHNHPLLQAILPHGINPFLSTGDTPYHSLKYAYGIKPYKGHEGERLRPRWQSNGQAERPYSGVVYLSLHPLSDYTAEGPLHLISLNRAAEIKLKDELNIIAERESCFPAYLPENRVIHKHTAKYPSFKESYKNIYYTKYGITKAFYKKLCERFAEAAPHSEEMKKFKKILGEWLCSYHEVRLIDIARKTAEKQGGILIYRDINGLFSQIPPVDSVNRHTDKITQEVKKPVKKKQQTRESLSPSNKADIQLITDEEDIEALTKSLHKLNLNQPIESPIQIKGKYNCNVEFYLLLNAVRYNRLLALEKYLTIKSFRQTINTLFTNEYFSDASLLHLAVNEDFSEAAKMLIDAGIKLQVKDNEGYTALDIALSKHQYVIAAAIVLAGGNYNSLSVTQSLKKIPYQFRSHVANVDILTAKRPEIIPKDIYDWLIALKNKRELIDKERESYVPTFIFFKKGKMNSNYPKEVKDNRKNAAKLSGKMC